ncbi:hypothetical protein [Millisia brevis]|uniref:hypothetical protein n=1 Tax=Millisia brevis TaxID=264148 RepID=UPI000836AAEA|nr:hypothetical protein [Millisia brevis]
MTAWGQFDVYIFFGILLALAALIALCFVFRPRAYFEMAHGWKFRDLEPTETYLMVITGMAAFLTLAFSVVSFGMFVHHGREVTTANSAEAAYQEAQERYDVHVATYRKCIPLAQSLVTVVVWDGGAISNPDAVYQWARENGVHAAILNRGNDFVQVDYDKDRAESVRSKDKPLLTYSTNRYAPPCGLPPVEPFPPTGN